MVKLHKINTQYTNEELDMALEASAERQRVQKFMDDNLGKDYFDKYLKIRDRFTDMNLKDFNKIIKLDPEDVKVAIDRYYTTSDATPDIKSGKKKVGENSDWVVYRVTSFPAAQELGEGTTWCITGRYGSMDPDDDSYFKNYIRDNNLDGGYYFYIPKNGSDDKYCLLLTKNGNIHSIWGSPNHQANTDEVEDQGFPSVRGIDLSSYEYYGDTSYEEDDEDNDELDADNIWDAIDVADEYYQLGPWLYDVVNLNEKNGRGIPLWFLLFNRFDDEFTSDIDNEDYLRDITFDVNLDTNSGENILDYADPSIYSNWKWLFEKGFNGDSSTWIDRKLKEYGTEESKAKFVHELLSFVDLSSIESDTCLRMLRYSDDSKDNDKLINSLKNISPSELDDDTMSILIQNILYKDNPVKFATQLIKNGILTKNTKYKENGVVLDPMTYMYLIGRMRDDVNEKDQKDIITQMIKLGFDPMKVYDDFKDQYITSRISKDGIDKYKDEFSKWSGTKIPE